MEAYLALELLSQGLGDTRPVAGCSRSLRELPLVSNTEDAKGVKLQGSSVQYDPALTLCTSGRGPSSGFGEEARDSGTSKLASEEDPPFSRPISAPPNLGAISASTLFAYPPAESAGCVDFLLGDIRYDEQYCEFYRNHVRDNPSLPKPLEEPSLLDLLPRLRARGANKNAEDGEVSAPAERDPVSTSSEHRGEVLAAAAAALLRQANPAAAQTEAAEAQDSGVDAAKRYEASKAQQQHHQQTWVGPYAAAGVPAAASRVATTSTRATYSGSSTERCSPNGEEEGEGDFVHGADWYRKDFLSGDNSLAPCTRGEAPEDAMGTAALPIDTDAGCACLPSFTDFYSAQQLASAAASGLAVHDSLDAPVGALLRVGHAPSLGTPVMGNPGLSGAYMGVSGGLSPTASNAIGEVVPDAMLVQQRNMLAVQQAAAAAWLMGGAVSPVATAQRAPAGTASDAWLASANLGLEAPLDLRGRGFPGLLQEQLYRQQLSARHLRDRRRRNRTENAIYEQYGGVLDYWGKHTVLQEGYGPPRDIRGDAKVQSTVSNGRSRTAPHEKRNERLASKGGGPRGRGATRVTGPHKDTGSPPRFTGADVLQADDDSLFRMAKDQGGCRLLQQLLPEGTREEVDRVFKMAFSRLVELMTDAYGNYLFQKLLDVCSDEQLRQLLQAITPHLRDICLDPHGTRTAQKLVEVICGSRQSASLTGDLIRAIEPLVVDLATDANGNHVIKRLLWCSNRENSTCNIEFILQAACDHCVHIATERHGCCVMQRCCEVATGVLKDQLFAEVASNALLLSQDPFGNYVVQHVLRHDHARIGSAIIMQLRGHVRELSEQKFASNVVENCLLLGNSEQRAEIIGELLEEPKELRQLVLHEYGNYVVQRALAVAGATQREALLDVVRFSLVHQHPSQHSRIAQKLMRRLRGQRQPPGTPGGAASSTNSWCCSTPPLRLCCSSTDGLGPHRVLAARDSYQ